MHQPGCGNILRRDKSSRGGWPAKADKTLDCAARTRSRWNGLTLLQAHCHWPLPKKRPVLRSGPQAISVRRRSRFVCAGPLSLRREATNSVQTRKCPRVLSEIRALCPLLGFLIIERWQLSNGPDSSKQGLTFVEGEGISLTNSSHASHHSTPPLNPARKAYPHSWEPFAV